MKISAHRLLVFAAVAIFAGSCLWAGWNGRRAAVNRPGATKLPASAESAYAPVGRDAPEVKTETWEPPAPQRAGREWVYEVFTAPEIFYSERSKQFSVAPPEAEPSATAAEPAEFGLELVSVRRDPFRLQLVGYVGGEGTYRGLFENVATTETLLAGGGRKLPALALTILDFAVRRQPVAMPDSMSTSRLVATAAVRDERTGQTITLTDTERFYPDAAVAVVRAGDGDPREVHAGDEFPAGAATYRVEKIQLAPPSLEVTKRSPAQPGETRTLTVPISSPPASPPPRA